MRTCNTEGCERPAAKDRGGDCYACAKWKQRHPGKRRNPREYGLKTRDRLRKVALEYANAETEQEYDRARMRLIRYAQKSAKLRIDELIERVARRVIQQLAGHSDPKAKVSRSKQTMSATSGKAAPTSHGDGTERDP